MPTFPTDEWFQAFIELINRSAEYRAAAADWEGDIAFLVQAEVADRVAAGPGIKDYGVLSVLMQSRFDVELSFVVPAGAFWPVDPTPLLK